MHHVATVSKFSSHANLHDFSKTFVSATRSHIFGQYLAIIDCLVDLIESVLSALIKFFVVVVRFE